MDIQKQRKRILEEIKKGESLSVDLQDRFQKQIMAMGDEEFSIFLRSVQGAKNSKNLDKEIAEFKEMEKSGHEEFLKIANDLSKKITNREAKKQRSDDKLEADAILNKIKSL